jgi:hypothetical protein
MTQDEIAHIRSQSFMCASSTRNANAVVKDSMDNYYGPYANKALAERVLKIVQMAADESAEMLSENVDPFSTEILSGLLPYCVEIMVLDGKVMETKVALTWPPKEHQGILKCTDFYREYFFGPDPRPTPWQPWPGPR